MGQNTGSGPGDDSSTKLAALGISDMRAYVSGELARIKDDIADLFEKLNAMKDASAEERLQLMAQLNKEFQTVTNRLNDFSMAVQNLMSASERSDDKLENALAKLRLEIDNKFMHCRIDLSHGVSVAEFEQTKTQLKILETQLTTMQVQLSALSKSEKATNSKVKNLTYKLGLVGAGLLWLADKFGSNILKALSGLSK